MWLSKTRVAADYFDRGFYEVTYQSDDLEVTAMLLDHSAPERIVIYLRGGKGGVGMVRPVRLMQFANSQTLVVGPYYRGTKGQGKDEFGGADLEDVRALVRELRRRYGDLPIHLIGFSRGGIQGLLTYQDVGATSFISWGGVSDIYYMYEERPDLRGMMKRLIGKPDVDHEGYNKRNGYMHVTEDSPPVMIIHGTDDMQVGIEHAYILEKRLKELDVPYELHIYEGEGHVFTPPNERDILGKIQEWMNKVEQNRKT
ncbi:alpha/beta hydrolase family protein [Macrococcus brunensis]|uniref:alpha/beta hydrolase family protein n=1 Tax=Macrococcus brunensis TaxID=198483 RepID=UPI001EF0A1CF|nr:prolyl oligopeptidase family serine peptidase [Macrococcus brunensis]ULG71421.1 prolyl oligopeptidase family serine peptidase [Macrococcus brunensis]